MISRRDILMGTACVAAAGASYALRPKRNVALLGKGKLSDIIPATFGGWRSEDIGDPLAINGPGTLSAKLYNQLLVRAYVNDATGAQVMMLLAYGGQQTDELQLHRPEVCYPAFGYELLQNDPDDLRLAAGVTVPARKLLAQGENGREAVVYWTRIGEALPRDGGEQRSARLDISLKGIIPDGLLTRFSAPASNSGGAWDEIEAFVPQLITAVAPQWRKVLIGSMRAQALSAAAPPPRA